MNNYFLLRENYGSEIILIKKGPFYYAYVDDAYIISYIFNYKLLKTSIEKNSDYVVFPNINKICPKLKKIGIGYIIYDGKIIDKNYGDSLIYNNYLNDALEYLGKKKIIDELVIFLNKLSLNELEESVLKFYAK